MSNDSSLSMEFLCDVDFLLQECGPEPEAEPAEISAIARVAARVASHIRRVAPSALPTCDHSACRLTATERTASGMFCPYHDPASDAGGWGS